MGCLWAAKIRQYAEASPVTLLLRDEAALSRLQRLGGVLIHTDGVEELVPVEASTIANSQRRIDNLLLCTKAHDAIEALESVAHLLSANSRVLLIQNGIKAQCAIAERFPTLALYALSTSHGAYLLRDYEVVHAGHGDAYLGALNPEAMRNTRELSPILNSLPCASMNIVWDTNITDRLWTKFAVNCAINALTVIYDCRNGDLLTLPAAVAQLRALCAEIESIMLTVAACPQPLALFEKVEAVLRTTAHNYSSTLQDVHNGRTTEIDYFNGFLCELARLADQDCPLNNAILRSFKVITKQGSD